MQINAIYCLKIHTMYSRNIKTGIGTINPKSGERKEKVFKDYRILQHRTFKTCDGIKFHFQNLFS